MIGSSYFPTKSPLDFPSIFLFHFGEGIDILENLGEALLDFDSLDDLIN